MKKIEKQKSKKNRGITLIALVITIIVLLILAGVSIATLTGENGILTRANEANTKTKEATAKEKVQVEIVGSYGTDGKIDIDKLNENLKSVEGLTKGLPISSLPADVFVDGYKVTINADGSVSVVNSSEGENTGTIKGKYYETDEDITVGEKPVTIPGGATVSGITGEYEDVENGFVIYITNGNIIKDWSNIEEIQQTYDQFVWVPVEKAYVTEDEIGGNSYVNLKNYVSTNGIYPMAIKLNNGSYKGILYDFKEENGAVTVIPIDYTTTSSYREPAYLTSTSSGDASSNNNIGITQEKLSDQYKTMIERIASKKGFWVGRYETTNMVNDETKDSTNKITVIKGIAKGINNVVWYRMYAQQKNYSNLSLPTNTSIKSSMIWGSQWDQIMIWMKNIKNTVNQANGTYYITNALGMGNFGVSGSDDYDDTRNPANTGCYDVKNIFDLAGNVCELTVEAYNDNSRVIRGEKMVTSITSRTSPTYRTYDSVSYTSANTYGSRTILY